MSAQPTCPDRKPAGGRAGYCEPPLQVAQVSGAARAWREAGVGARSPLILLHGISSNSRSWAGQFPAFATTRRVIAWNAPGYLASGPLAKDWPEARDYAAALDEFLAHLGVRRCVLMGQSLGATMAASFAASWPDRVERLFLVSPARGYGIRPDSALPDGIRERIAEMTQLGPQRLAQKRAHRLLTQRAPDVALEIVRSCMSELTPHGYMAAARMLASADIVHDASQLRVPTVVVWGDQDRITPPDKCRLVADAIQGAAAVELPNLGHACAVEDPDRFNTAVSSFLDLP